METTHANHRDTAVRGTPVAFQHIFHVVHEGGAGLREDAPAFLQPRFQHVF